MLAPTVVSHGTEPGPPIVPGTGAAVAGRGRDEHAGVVREQEGDVVAAGEARAATDRVVDHVDAVCDGRVDRVHQVGA